jgi:uncharacterized membrane protein YphA (DoxX/SURF4 family)
MSRPHTPDSGVERASPAPRAVRHHSGSIATDTVAPVTQPRADFAPRTVSASRGLQLGDWTHLAARLLLAVVLLWAGLAKASDHQSVVLAVNAYRLLPQALVDPVAAALPWVEIALGGFLLLGTYVRFAGAAAAVLVVGFLVALAQAKARGLAIDCGCFGGGGPGDGVGWLDLFREIPLIAAGAFLAWRPSGPLVLDRYLQREVDERGAFDQ